MPNPECTLNPEVFAMRRTPVAQRVGGYKMLPPRFSERGARTLCVYEPVRSSWSADPLGSEMKAVILF